MPDNFHILEKHYRFNNVQIFMDAFRYWGLQGDPLETGAVALSWSPGTEMYPTGPCTQMGRYW